MMDENYKEFTGDSIDDAKEKAKDYFNTKHVEYEIIDHDGGKNGFFSKFKRNKEVKIKAKKVEITHQVIDVLEDAKQYLKKLLEAATLDLTIEDTLEDNQIRFNLMGDDVSYFKEDKGALLDSFQHIVSRAALHKNYIPDVKIIVDADDYRVTKEGELKSYARKICKTVRDKNKPYILKPMNPADRRIVHITVQEEMEVESESIGNSFYKKVKIKKIGSRDNNGRNNRRRRDA